MLTLSVPNGEEGSAMVARLPRRVCGVGGVDREVDRALWTGRVDGRAAAAPRPFLERRPTRLRIRRGRAEPSPGPARTRPKAPRRGFG